MNGTYHATKNNRLLCRDVDGTIKIQKSGSKVTFTNVYIGREGLKSGPAENTDVSVYDKGVCYWKAKYTVECKLSGDTVEWSGNCYANKKGKTLYIGSTTAAYAK